MVETAAKTHTCINKTTSHVHCLLILRIITCSIYPSFNNFCNCSLSALATSCSTYLSLASSHIIGIVRREKTANLNVEEHPLSSDEAVDSPLTCSLRLLRFTSPLNQEGEEGKTQQGCGSRAVITCLHPLPCSPRAPLAARRRRRCRTKRHGRCAPPCYALRLLLCPDTDHSIIRARFTQFQGTIKEGKEIQGSRRF